MRAKTVSVLCLDRKVTYLASREHSLHLAGSIQSLGTKIDVEAAAFAAGV